MDGNESDGSNSGYEERWNDIEEYSHGSGGDNGGGGNGGAGDDDDDDSEEERPYDISIAASHSYLGPGLVSVGGRSVLEAGWRGCVPALARQFVVYPGETVPMLLQEEPDAALLVQAIKRDKLFGLLSPDESGAFLSGYGVLCEVMMAGIDEEEEMPLSVAFKARAIHRFRLQRVPKPSASIDAYAGMRVVQVMVLAEVAARDPLRAARLGSLDARRGPRRREPAQRRLRSMDAMTTPWPLFMYDFFDYDRMRLIIQDYFKTMLLDDKMPDEPVSLSFWVASNMPLSARDRLALFVVDHALLRLHMECHFISRKSELCCSSCMTLVARREHIFAMSSEGVHSNYTNSNGFMHDILTVSETSNVETSGITTAEYSWFPGYTWTVAVCANCMVHIGWKFAALKRNLRPSTFYGLCRNKVEPDSPDAPDSEQDMREFSPEQDIFEYWPQQGMLEHWPQHNIIRRSPRQGMLEPSPQQAMPEPSSQQDMLDPSP